MSRELASDQQLITLFKQEGRRRAHCGILVSISRRNQGRGGGQ